MLMFTPHTLFIVSGALILTGIITIVVMIIKFSQIEKKTEKKVKLGAYYD